MDAVCGILRFMAMGKVVQNSSRVHAGVNFCILFDALNFILHNISEFQFHGGLGSADIGDLVTEGKNLKILLSDRLRGP